MLRHPRIALAALGLTAGACNQEASLEDPVHPTGSQAAVVSTDRSALFVANVRHGSVSRLDVATESVTLAEVGSEPTRVAAAGDRVFVTLRGERRVAVLDATKTTPEIVATVEVGHEPYGVVAAEGGARVFVSVSQQDRVVEIDPATLEVVGAWAVPGEPRWMTLHPGGDHLYVASAMQGLLTTVPTDGGDPQTAPVPELWYGGGLRKARITGDPAVAPDGRTVAIPTLHLDNETPIDDTGRVPPGGYYGGRIGPTLTLVPVSGGELKYDDATIVNVPQGGGTDGYVSSATWSPTGDELYLSVEGSAAVIVMRFEADEPPSDGGLFGNIVFGERGADGAPEGGRPLDGRATRFMKAPAGARAVAFVDADRAFTYGFLDRDVQALAVPALREGLDDAEYFGLFTAPTEVLVAGPRPAIEVAPLALPAEIDRGQRLFYSTVEDRMTSGSGLSCATCHFDGRTDGLSWTFERGKFQTPSLAGDVSATAPVRWQGDRETVAIDAQRTSEDAMGGLGLDDAGADDVAAFVDWVRDVDVPRPSVDDPAVARGRALFERADVGCASCHSGPRYTDNVSYTMFGLDRVQTRSLVGLAATAPYLHDGSAATLRDVLDRGGMGDTSALSDADKADLVAYLRTL